MPTNHFKQTYRIRFSDTDIHKQCAIPALIRFFEEVAILQSEALQVGFDYYQRNQVVWMMHQLDVHIRDTPAFNENIVVKTQPYSVFRFFGYRKYWVSDAEGRDLVEADSAWLFINTQTKRPSRVTDDVKLAYGHLGAEEVKLDIQPILPIERIDLTQEFCVRQEDIDVNMHVNHTRYVTWALETMPIDVARSFRLKRLRVDYKKETLFGTIVTSQIEMKHIGNHIQCIHAIKDQHGQEKCLLMTEWEPAMA